MLLDYDDMDRAEDRCMADYNTEDDECATCRYRGYDKCQNQCEWILSPAGWRKVWGDDNR